MSHRGIFIKTHLSLSLSLMSIGIFEADMYFAYADYSDGDGD